MPDLDFDTTNRGLIRSSLITGSQMISGLNQMKVLMPKADWEDRLPVFEFQKRYGFESNNCVQFSFDNTLETTASFHGIPLNLSDRFMYWASGCTVDGNTFENCYLGFKRNGGVTESRWPWSEGLNTRPEYGKQPPDDVRAEAWTFFDTWDLRTPVYVSNNLDAMRFALQRGPLWIANSYHATMIYRIDDRIRVFDTYNDSGEGRGSYSLGYASQLDVYLVPLTPKAVPMPDNKLQIPQFALVTGVFENGLHRAFFKDGSLYYDGDNSKEVLLAWIENNTNPVTHMFTGGPTIQITRDDWEKFPLVNFKGLPYEYPVEPT